MSLPCGSPCVISMCQRKIRARAYMNKSYSLPRFASILLLSLFAACGVCQNALADIRMPQVFGSHMVLQRYKPIIIWGWANPAETVTVQLGQKSKSARANERGEWKVVLPSMSAGGPFTLTVSGSSTVTYDDVMIGEVWLCSGQSNMEFGMGMLKNSAEEIAAADHPGIRLLLVKHDWLGQPTNDIDGTWKVSTPQSVTEGGWNGFSA